MTTRSRSRSAARSRPRPRPWPRAPKASGLIVAAIILLITFGSVVAMGLPLITALFGLGIAMALGEVLRRFVDVPDWAPYTAAMVGVGVGIDYALLIVTRFRSSLADGQDPREATQTAIVYRGPLRPLRGHDGGHLHARHPADGPAGHERIRLHGGARRPGRDGRDDDAAPGHPRLRRPQHRASARAVRQQEASARTTRRAGTAGAGSSSAAPGGPPSVRWPCWSRWRLPSWASASASPTPATTHPP